MSGFTAADVPDQAGRTVLVTGANSGIGFAAAQVLAKKGAHVFMACRDHARAVAACNAILKKMPQAKVEWLPLDLADLASVHRAAEIAGREPHIDVLINNAGVMRPPLGFTADGFELQFGINHLAHFALTGLLLDKMGGPDPRVVTVSSIAHRRGEIDFANFDASHRYSRMKFYEQSKLANIVFMAELDRRLRAAGSPVKSVGCHPGLAGTGLGRGGGVDALAFKLAGLLFNTAQQGAWPTLQAATDPSAIGGEYFGPQGLGETRGKSGRATRTQYARDPDVAASLWEVSVELTGVDPGLPAT